MQYLYLKYCKLALLMFNLHYFYRIQSPANGFSFQLKPLNGWRGVCMKVLRVKSIISDVVPPTWAKPMSIFSTCWSWAIFSIPYFFWAPKKDCGLELKCTEACMAHCPQGPRLDRLVLDGDQAPSVQVLPAQICRQVPACAWAFEPSSKEVLPGPADIPVQLRPESSTPDANEKTGKLLVCHK